MNLIGHYVAAYGAPESFKLGASLPDLLGLFSRKMRLPPLEKHWAAQPELPPDLMDLIEGVAYHHHVDRHFHKAPLFTETQAALMTVLQEASQTPGLKRFFPAHVLTELYLDHLLIVRQGEIPGFFTRTLLEGQELALQWVAPHPGGEGAHFELFLERIIADRFWEDYQLVPRLFYRMNRILKRFHMRKLEPAETEAVSEWLITQQGPLTLALDAFLLKMKAALPLPEANQPAESPAMDFSFKDGLFPPGN